MATAIEAFEAMNRVRFRPKSELWWARAIGFFWADFMTKWWTTIRFPFQLSVIAYPDGIDPMEPRYAWIVAHEMEHVEQQRGPWGLFKSAMLCFFVPLPVVFSGRWYLEREPYLHNILGGHKTIDKAVDNLWRFYLWAWPKPRMRRWFERKVLEAEGW